MQGKPKILIVDDVVANLKILVELLRDDYEIFLTTNGQDALNVAGGEEGIDMILLDVLMPGMDGHEVLRRLKMDHSTSDIPVIFVTALNEATDEAGALLMGAVDFLTKPVSAPVVRARIKTHIGLRQARSVLEKQNIELQQAYITIASHNQELQAAARLREDVDVIMRHDLKTPLNAIIAFTDILANDLELTSAQQEMFQLILDSSYKLLDQINLSMDLYKMENGTYVLKAVAIDLLQIFNRLIKLHSQQYDFKTEKIKLTVSGSSPDPSDTFFILGEELLCFSMFNNLIKNAIDASFEKTSVIDIDISKKEMAEIRIRNDGSVPLEIWNRFFEKHVTSGKKDGTGLGTYSARLMAQNQNGSIHLAPYDGKETTILVRLPLQD